MVKLRPTRNLMASPMTILAIVEIVETILNLLIKEEGDASGSENDEIDSQL